MGVLQRLAALARRVAATLEGKAGLRIAEQAVRDPVQFANELFDSVPVALSIRDAAGKYLFVNRAWEKTFGDPREKVIGQRVRDRLDRADAAKLLALDRRALERGPGVTETLDFEFRGRSLLQTRTAVAGEQGGVLGVLIATIDVTERRAQEQKLRDQMALTRALIEENPNPMFMKDIDGRYIEVNDAWLKLVGLTREQAMGRTVLELFPEKESERYHAEDLKLLRQRAGWSEMESQRTGPDGKPQWVLIRKAVLQNADGLVIGLIGTNTDITRLKQYEAQLATDERRLALVVNAAKVGIVDWDGKTHATFYSPRFREILGYPPDADTSQWPDYFKVMIHPEERERITQRWRDFVKGKGREGRLGEYYAPEEYRLLRADGSYVWVQASGIAVRDESGFVTRWIAAITDVTERRAQEEALRDSVRLREEVERMSRHDLKTPLNSVIAVSRLLREGGHVSREDEELLSIVERAGYRILSMVNLSLDLFRMESGTYQFRPQAIDLADVAHKVTADLESQAASKEVALVLRQSGRSIARAEELLSYSMLANLVKNAIEAEPEGGTVSVTVEGAGPRVSVHVHNSGAVPERMRGRFFEKYATTGKSAGLGLGTYSALLMARVQEGDITLHSTEEAGTTLSVRLHAADEFTAPAERAAAPTASRAERLPSLPPLRVLVVDDDEFNRLVLRHYLPTPPLTLDMAVNGRAALDAARENWPDVVLLDLEMPVMDGYECAYRLRALEKGRKPVRIIAISSNDEPAIMARARAAGCDQYLVKPAPRETLWRLLAGEEVPAADAGLRTIKDSDPVEIDGDLRASLPEFLRSRRAVLDEMPPALAANDRVRFRKLAHKLAGSFSMYGFKWATAECHALERAAAADEAGELARRVAALRGHLDGVAIRWRETKTEGTA